MATLNKRFLGLGFTFAAEDKGLEKQLVKISGLFDEISKKAAKIGSVSVGGAATRTVGGVVGAENKKQKSEQAEPKAKEAIKSSVESSSLSLDGLVDKYASILGDLGDSFKSEATKMIKNGERQGKSTERMRKDLQDTAAKAAEGAALLGARFERIKVIFHHLSEYAGQVGKSVDNFLSVLGLNFREILPKEIQAAFGVMRAIVAKPLGMITGKISGFFENKRKGKVDILVQKIYDVLGKMKDENKVDSTEIIKANAIAFQTQSVIGTSKSLPSIQKMLSILVGQGRASNAGAGDDIFSDLQGALGKFAKYALMAAAPLGLVMMGMAKGFKEFLAGEGPVTKSLQFLWQKLMSLAEWIGESKIGEWLKGIGESIAESKIVTWLKGLGEAIAESKFAIWLKGIGEAVSESALVGKLIEFGSWLGKGVEYVKAFGVFLGSGVAKIIEFGAWLGKSFEALAEVSKFFKFFKIIGEFGGKFVPIVGQLMMLWDVVTGVIEAFKDATGIMDFFVKAVLNIVNNVFGGLVKKFLGDDRWNAMYNAASASTQTPLPITATGPAAAMQSNIMSMSDVSKMTDALAAQIEQSKETNSLMRQSIDSKNDNSMRPQVDLNIVSKPKEFSFSFGKQQNTSMINSGVSN